MDFDLPMKTEVERLFLIGGRNCYSSSTDILQKGCVGRLMEKVGRSRILSLLTLRLRRCSATQSCGHSTRTQQCLWRVRTLSMQKTSTICWISSAARISECWASSSTAFSRSAASRALQWEDTAAATATMEIMERSRRKA